MGKSTGKNYWIASMTVSVPHWCETRPGKRGKALFGDAAFYD